MSRKFQVRIIRGSTGSSGDGQRVSGLGAGSSGLGPDHPAVDREVRLNRPDHPASAENCCAK